MKALLLAAALGGLIACTGALDETRLDRNCAMAAARAGANPDRACLRL